MIKQAELRTADGRCLFVWSLFFFCLLWGLLFSTTPHAEPLKVQLLLSEQSGPYSQFETALRQQLAPHQAKIQLSATGEAPLRLTVGLGATEAALGGGPLLAVMLPQASYQALSQRSRVSDFSAIYLDQPWSRQIHLIAHLFPSLEQVGVLYSPSRSDYLDELQREAATHRLQLISRKVESPAQLFAVLEQLLPQVGVILATPDKQIFNKNQVRNVLLTSYRYKKPLLGLSESWVTAGALAAIYSTPEQLAEQTVAALLYFAEYRKLPAAQYPKQFQVAINQQVARSLGLQLASPEQLKRELLLQESAP